MENNVQQDGSQPITYNHRNKILLPVGMLLLALLSGIIGYIIGTKEGSIKKLVTENTKTVYQQPRNTTLQPTNIPITISPTMSTIDWKTLVDSIDGISFKYPNNWTYTTGPNGVISFEFNPIGTKKPQIAFVVGAFFYEHAYADALHANLYGDTNITQQPITIAGLHGQRQEGFANPEKKEIDGVYILNKDGKAIEFTYTNYNGQNYGQYAEKMMDSLVFSK
ncbi:MAG TPA: hypothetical protein VLG12_07650 [Candidatus Saccharimonadales bacterium]|nr:hypothetical protein [Candidatus Saccharimonadales bacterium]